MQDFIRARSCEQKAQRIDEIKAEALCQFGERPYREITLTTIAEALGWSRASLYKYVSTKEEIFLLLAADACRSYFDALLTALPEGCGFSTETIAEVWAGIANAHREYFRMGDLLFTVIETNVSVERLAAFKRDYYDRVAAMEKRLPLLLPIERERVRHLLETIYFHAIGYCGACAENPLVRAALERIGVTPEPINFRVEMRDFIRMCLTDEVAR